MKIEQREWREKLEKSALFTKEPMNKSARVVCVKEMVPERGAVSREYWLYSKKTERSYGAIFSQNTDDVFIQRFPENQSREQQ